MTDQSTPFIRLGNLTRADGSAIICQGGSTVQVAIFGPGDVPLHKELPDKATVDIVFKSSCRSKETTPDDRLLQGFVRSVVESIVKTELYPKSIIQVVVQEMESDGCLLSLIINCVCAALLDSGLSMRHMVASITACINDKRKVIINPDSETLQGSHGSVTVVFDSISKDIAAMTTQISGMTPKEISSCITTCQQESGALFTLYHQLVQETFQ